MWTIDISQHIHVESTITEREVLDRATSVAQLSSGDQPIFLDIIASPQLTCTCNQPADWKTYQVILYALEGQKRSGGAPALL